MGDHNHLFKAVRFCVSLSILIFAVSVLASEKTDDVFVFVPTHNDPPASCPPNEFYRTCLSNCSDCEHRGICDMDGCKHKGCDCVMNFARLTPGGPCEPVHMCPVPECGENEVFRECGPVCEMCGIMRCRILHCEHKCYCKQGYLRNWEGKCVPEDECPKQPSCGRNEKKADSGLSDEYCLHAEDEEVSNATETKERCYCEEGFKRNVMGHCVPEDHCQYVQCLNKEVYQLCPKRCNMTCRSYGDSTCEEDGQCYPGCFCPDGQVMNDVRRCVPLDECPPGSNPFAPTVGPTTTPAMTESTTPTSNESSTPSSQATESVTSGTTPVSTTAETSGSTVVEETAEASVEEDAKTSPLEEDEDAKTSVPVTPTTETPEEEEKTEEPEETTSATTPKPRSQKGRRNEKERKLTLRVKKVTTPTEEDIDNDKE